MNRYHPDADVDLALAKLLDSLVSWERGTGRQSILVLREFGGFAFRADCGVPLDEAKNGDITDAQLFQGLRNREGRDS